MPTATATISITGSGQLTIHVNDGETVDDLFKLSDAELVERIIDIKDIMNNCIDDDGIEFDDIILDR